MRKKILGLGVVVGVLAALGIAFAAWTASGTGSGRASAISAQALTVNAQKNGSAFSGTAISWSVISGPAGSTLTPGAATTDAAGDARAFEPVVAAVASFTPRVEVTRAGTCSACTRSRGRASASPTRAYARGGQRWWW